MERIHSFFRLLLPLYFLALLEGLANANSVIEQNRGVSDVEVFIFMNSALRIGVFTFLSAVFAGLTLGVMCADIFTLEIVAESGRMPLCTYARKIIPLRKQGHKTLCTLIISNMLFNVLIVQEFSHIFRELRASPSQLRGNGESPSSLSEFITSTLFIVFFTEMIPMSVCKSSYSLRVAAAGSGIVRVAMIITYPVAVPLGKILDFIVGATESGQIFDKNELRRLMIVHYERETDGSKMPKTELKLLLAAMDFEESKVGDIMTPLSQATMVREDVCITADFVERIWMSGRSRILVQDSLGKKVKSILMAKDLMGFRRFKKGTTVLDVVQARRRVFATVGEHTPLPLMLKFFQDSKIHMAVVVSEDNPVDGNSLSAVSTSRSKRVQRDIGVITLEDVVEKMLNDQIYDEYDSYDRTNSAESVSAMTVTKHRTLNTNNQECNSCFPYLRPEPVAYPRVNFYSYFTHPEKNVPLTDSQIWAVAYFLQRALKTFALWTPSHIHLLLSESKDQQFNPSFIPASNDKNKGFIIPSEVKSSSDVEFQNDESTCANERHMAINTNVSHQQLQEETPPEYILYRKGVPTNAFTLVLGGTVDLLIGDDCFHASLHIFDFIGEDALLLPSYIPDFTAVVGRPARVYQIYKELFDRVHSLVEAHQKHTTAPADCASSDPSYASPVDDVLHDTAARTFSPNEPIGQWKSLASSYGSLR